MEGATGKDVGFGGEVDGSAFVEEEVGSMEVVSMVVESGDLGDLPMVKTSGQIWGA